MGMVDTLAWGERHKQHTNRTCLALAPAGFAAIAIAWPCSVLLRLTVAVHNTIASVYSNGNGPQPNVQTCDHSSGCCCARQATIDI